MIDMIYNRRVWSVPILAIGLCFIVDTASASTRGYDPGNPGGGLLILLAFLVVLTIFICAYMLFDRAMQKRVTRLKESNDIEGLAHALRSPLLGAKAARAMGETGDERAVEPLINALGDKREDVRRAAAEALGKLGDRRAVEPLSRTLNDNYASVRDQARRALKCIEKNNAQNI
jgi:hypothetical protein